MPVGCVVITDDVQVLAGIGGGDLLQEAQELAVAVARVTGVDDLPVAVSRAANKAVVPWRM